MKGPKSICNVRGKWNLVKSFTRNGKTVEYYAMAEATAIRYLEKGDMKQISINQRINRIPWADNEFRKLVEYVSNGPLLMD